MIASYLTEALAPSRRLGTREQRDPQALLHHKGVRHRCCDLHARQERHLHQPASRDHIPGAFFYASNPLKRQVPGNCVVLRLLQAQCGAAPCNGPAGAVREPLLCHLYGRHLGRTLKVGLAEVVVAVLEKR